MVAIHAPFKTPVEFQLNNTWFAPLPLNVGTRCGKTRAVIELLSQQWGFYFNASSDDWGSNDKTTLHSAVEQY
ncbi:hypothetical protein BG003_011622 [Podila horticola]|nr:hypothetical protein BG003_011622 [Podila horticola]